MNVYFEQRLSTTTCLRCSANNFLMLHLPRSELDETVFWNGQRSYTRANDRWSMVTADF